MVMDRVRPIYGALVRDDAHEFERLLHSSPDLVEYQSSPIPSWLHAAAAHGSLNVAKVLFAHGWTANSSPGGRVINPLWEAKGKHFEMAKFLLDNGADPNVGRSLIGAINSPEALKWVKLFVDYGADVNWCVLIAADKPYWATPLSWAKELGEKEVADYLLSKGGVMPDDPKAKRQQRD